MGSKSLYKAVIFDLDGTLLDSIQDLADATNHALEQLNFPTHNLQSYKKFIGDGVDNLIDSALPKAKRTNEIHAKCKQSMLSAYEKGWANKTCPYVGIGELLDELVKRKIKLAVLSNKMHEFVLTMVEKLLCDWPFDVVFGYRNNRAKKPDPQVALEIANMLELEPFEIAFVGDSGIDMETATAAGMFAVGALWGFRDAEELRVSGAQILIERPLDLIKLF